MKQIAYQRVPGKHCLCSTLASLLRYYAWCDLNEALVCVLSGQPQIAFKELIRSPDDPPVIQLFGVTFSGEKTRRYLGVDLNQSEEADPAVAWQLTQNYIDRNEPQVVHVDMYDLPYLKEHYRIHHGHHPLTVVGYDHESAYISDIDYDGTITIQDLQRSRSSAMADEINAWWALRFFDRPDLSFQVLVGAIAENTDLMYQNAAPHTPSLMESSVAAGRGLAEAIGRWSVTLDERKLEFVARTLYYQVLMDVVYPRRLFISCLQHLQSQLNREVLDTSIGLFDQAANTWAITANLIVKAFLYTRPASLLAPRIQDRILSIVDTEQQAWGHLRQAITTL